jgi:hypothetical protein
MNMRRGLILAVAALLMAPVARSGHELPVYPSYYPHEIEIAAIAPERALELVGAGKLHAYVGNLSSLVGAPGDGIDAVESLGSLIVVRLNPGSPRARDEATACATAAALVRDMVGRAGFTVHPYPVTPRHGDYLNHADRAEAARQRFLASDAAAVPAGLKVRAATALAHSLVRPDWRSDGDPWDAAVEEVSAAGLVAETTVALNGWLGPRWTRSGWFQAYRVLGPAIAEPTQKAQIEADVERLQTAATAGPVERINLERGLVRSLLSSCRALVAGYTVKREPFNATFSAGIENMSFDALEGLSSPMFLRTVKLKDFPWNGWLQLGVEARPDAAWNPVGGFTDPFGRLMWFAIADPAAIPSPYESAWTLNRFSDVEASPRQ